LSAIRNIGRMTIGEMREEIKRGARFVVFEYVISLILVSRQQVSPTFFIRAGESTFFQSLPYTLITAVLGWWSFPFGPANTIVAIRDNLRGGRDVSAKTIDEILEAADKQMKRKRSK
jgi:hypothetical protein